MADDEQATLPSFFCPISMALMNNPVTCSDGFTYERSSIETWLQSNTVSPMTGMPLQGSGLIPNHNLRNAIQEWKEHRAHLISRSEFEIEQQPISVSSLKIVYKGHLHVRGQGEQPRRVPVAVLKVKKQAGPMESGKFPQLGRHPRLARYMGRCDDNGWFLLLREFAEFGTLHGAFENLEGQISWEHKAVMMQQIAQGMEFLAENGVLHQDLSTRSVLLFGFNQKDAEKTSVKVADYGLLTGSNHCTYSMEAIMNGRLSFNTNGRPVRYMSPEAIKKRQYTEKSDVWAFGVTCWEIMTSGKTPYFHIADDESVSAYVCDGGRLRREEIDEGCPDRVWELVQCCWKENDENRPKFSELVVSMGNLRGEGSEMNKRKRASGENEGDEDRCAKLRKISEEVVSCQGEEFNQSVAMVICEMRSHKEDVGVQEAGFMALDSLISCDEKNPMQVRRAGGIEAVVWGMGRNLEHAGVQKQGLKLLTSMISRATINDLDVVNTGAIEIAVNGMLKHEEIAEMQEAACKFLSVMTVQKSKNEVRVSEAGGMEAVVRAMEKHAAHAGVQEAACRALGNMTFYKEILAEAVADGRMKSVLRAMEQHGENAAVLKAACQALSNMAVSDTKNQIMAGEKGGMEAIVRAMEKHTEDSELQEAACNALGSMIFGAGKKWNEKIKENQVRAGAAGGVEAVVKAMEEHKEHKGVQLMAGRALDSFTGGNQENQIRAAAAGGIEGVVRAMVRHRRDLKVQKSTCRALRSMTSGDKENRVRAGAAGGIEAVVKGMKKHGFKSTYWEYAIDAMQSLVADCSENQDKAGEAGAIKEVLEGIKRFFDIPYMMYPALELLAILTDGNKMNQMRAGEAGGVQVVLDKMCSKFEDTKEGACKAFISMTKDNCELIERANDEEWYVHVASIIENEEWGADVHEAALRVLASTIPYCDDYQAEAEEDEIISATLNSMEKNWQHAGVQEAACLALCTLTFQNEVNQGKAIDLDGISIVTRSAEVHMENAEVLYAAFKALYIMTEGRTSQDCGLVGREGGIEVVIRGMLRHVDHPMVQQEGSNALYFLAEVKENQQRARDAGGIEATARALEKFMENEDVRVAACRALESLTSYNEENQDRVRAVGGIEAVVRMMGMSGDDQYPYDAACNALGNIVADNEENKKRAAAAGGIEALMRTLEQHGDGDYVKQSVYSALAFVIDGNKENQVRAAAAGAIEAVVTGMSEVSLDDSQLQLSACRALDGMTRGNKDNQDRAGRAGGIEAVVKAMRSYKKSLGIQETACKALSSMTSGNKENQIKAAAAKAIELVVSLGTLLPHEDPEAPNHDSTVALQKERLNALESMTAGNAENQCRAGAAGGIEAVVQTIEKWSHRSVRAAAFRALDSMTAGNSDNQDKAEAAGGIEVAMKNSTKYVYNDTDKKFVFRALESMVAGNAKNLNKIRKSSVRIRDMVHNLFEYNTESELVVTGFRLLVSLAADPEIQVELGWADVVNEVVKAMRRLLKCVEVQVQGSRALITITDRNEESQDRAGFAGAMEVVVMGMEIYRENPEVQEAACGALGSMTAGNRKTQERANKAGGVEAVVRAMEKHGNHAAVQEAACKSLHRLTAGNKENKVKADAAGGVEAVVRAMQQHGENAGLQEAACRALISMSNNNAGIRQRVASLDGMDMARRAFEVHQLSVAQQLVSQ